jgi:molybdopterin molybdotransferase
MPMPLTLARALAEVLAHGRRLAATESVPLAAALGRVLAADVVADAAWPATDRAAMDGFAVVAGAGLVAGLSLPVLGESLAGKPFAAPLAAGHAIRIMTGAVVPVGADAVVAVEQTSGFGGGTVTLHAPVRAGQHVRRAGSELAAGTVVLPAGTLVRAAEVGVLAVLGHAEVAVVRRPRVAIVATGDEVVPIERQPLPHQVRESNSWALAAQVAASGGEAVRLGIAPDAPAPLRAMLQRGLDEADVLVTIGGISAGTHDLVHGELAALGVRTVFHGIDLKPGKPTFFGVLDAANGPRFVFGLPGNPASSFTVFDLLVRPLLLAMLGRPVGERTAALPAAGAPWQGNVRYQAVPARLVATAAGVELELAAPSPSGDPFRLAGVDVYALIPGNTPPGAVRTLGVAGSSHRNELP